VLSKTDRVLPKKEAARDDAGDDADQEEQDDDEIEVKVLEEQSEFDEIVVWGHEAIMDEADPYVRGMEEWIGLAEKVCCA
jgi:ribonuclease H2 subunit C